MPNNCCNPREFADAIERLILLRITLAEDQRRGLPADQVRRYIQMDEQCELLKRQITDYLILNSNQRGVYKE